MLSQIQMPVEDAYRREQLSAAYGRPRHTPRAVVREARSILRLRRG